MPRPQSSYHRYARKYTSWSILQVIMRELNLPAEQRELMGRKSPRPALFICFECLFQNLDISKEAGNYGSSLEIVARRRRTGYCRIRRDAGGDPCNRRGYHSADRL